jgi:hypothetical protein
MQHGLRGQAFIVQNLSPLETAMIGRIAAIKDRFAEV